MASLEFKNLPLVEVSVRAFFADHVPLNLAVLQGVAAALGGQFSRFADQEVPEPTPVKLSSVITGAKIGGFRLEGNDLGIEASVQTHLITAQWLRRFGEGARPYPRFGGLRDSLWAVTDAVTAHVAERPPVIKAVNILYANFIPSGGASFHDVLGRYLADDARVGVGRDAARFHDLNVSWRSKDGIDQRFFVCSGEHGELKGYVLGTVAGAEVAEQSPPRILLELVHDRLQAFFRELISVDAKKEWGLVE
jgi:hypothetical protein